MENLPMFLRKGDKPWEIDDFSVEEFLGKGKFGLVYRAVHKTSQCEVAIKILSKEAIKTHNMVKQLRREIEIHSRLKHKHILNMFGYFHDKSYVYVILELASAGSLFKKVVHERQLTEAITSKYLFQLASAIYYMQTRKVIHRDLKLENILIDKDDNLKVCDLGWAVHNIGNSRNTICGTIDYLAPEIVDEQEYDEAVDVWCLGILMFEMLYGFPPFHSKKKEETFEKIRSQKLVFHEDVREISAEAKDLLEKLIGFERETRIKIEDALKHEFFAKNLGDWYKNVIKGLQTN